MALANGIKIVGEEPYAENLHVRFYEGQADSNHSHYDILTQYKMKERECRALSTRLINMTLKELRLSKELTQSQVAKLVGISLRSYKEYENDVTKINTLKYNYIFNELSKINYIDEEHGILKIDNIKKIVSDVLSNFDVDYCYLFGSYAKNNANELSDVDLLVSTKITGMAFFGLAERLRESLHKKVDLLNIEQLTNNQVLLNEILRNGIKIYGKE